MNQGYFAYVDEDTNEEEKLLLSNATKANLGTLNSQTSLGKFYKNLKIIPRNQNSKNTLTKQLSKAQVTASGVGLGFGAGTNMQSLRNQVFNINSEGQIDNQEAYNDHS